MNFEELFVKQRPPKDYVSYPPQETPTLEKFFQDRANTLGPISEDAKNEIKSKFTLPQTPAAPAPQAAPQEVSQAAPQVAPEAPLEQEPESYFNSIQEETPVEQPSRPPISFPSFEQEQTSVSRSIADETIPDQAEKMLPKRTWTDFLPYLVPLAVGAISGQGFGEPSRIAGEGLLGAEADRMKRKNTLEDKLMELQKARISKKGGAVQAKQLRNKITGEYSIGRFDPSQNVMYLPDGSIADLQSYELAPGQSSDVFRERQNTMTQETIKRGEYFGRGKFINPETGLISTIKNGKVVPLQIQENQLDPKQQKDLTNIVKDFKASDAYKKPLAALQDAVAADSLLLAANSGNPIAANAARTKLARMSGEVGALSDTDLAAYGGSPALKSQAKRFAHLQKTTVPLTPPEIAQLQEIVNIFEKSARMNMNNSVAGLESDFIQMGGVPGAVQTKMSPFIPSRGASKSGSSRMVLIKNLQTGQDGYIPQANLKKALEAKDASGKSRFSLVNKK